MQRFTFFTIWSRTNHSSRLKSRVQSTITVAEYLERHSSVKKVFYPGLKSHPGYEIARRQMSGFSAIVSFEVNGGTEAVDSFLRKVKIFSLAESLGGVDSLVEHPANMSHASMPKDFRERIGIIDSLIRLSMGLENIDDLIEDLEQALQHASRS